MINNKKKYLLFLPLIAIIALIFYWNAYIKFEPLKFENDSYKKIEVNEAFYNNLSIVLDYNKVKYRINENGKILIKRSLSFDKDLMLNYTRKALDSAWLNSHNRSL